MVSAIDPAKPVAGNPTTESVRANFQTAKDEISALQESVGSMTAAEVAITPPIGTLGANVQTGLAALNANSAALAHNAGRNVLHNPLMAIAQRGTSFTGYGYTLDRWASTGSGDAFTVSQGVTADAGRTAIGDEEAAWSISNSFTGNAAAGSHTTLTQYIEGVRRLAGKTVTISFWAVAASGAPKLGVSIDQSFGAGGSPSASVEGAGVAVPVTTNWTRYSVTLAIPSVIGKTLGTDKGDATLLRIWYSSGTANAVRSGNIGVQSSVISLWGTQMEVGNVATPLEKPDPQQDLSRCQRFFWTAAIYVGANTDESGTQIVYPTTMRATPIVTGGGPGFAGSGSANAATINVSQTAGAMQTLAFSADL